MAADTRFAYGYSGQTLTWDELARKATVAKLHPEVQRRLHALLEAAAADGVLLGVGTGWRIQPTGKKGFAKPGNSNHEGFPADGKGVDALAIDTVPPAAWDWLGKNCGRFGFRTFTHVNNEPWHIQPSEIPASRNRASVCPKLDTWDLPGTDAAVGAAVGAAPPPTDAPAAGSTPAPQGDDDDMMFDGFWRRENDVAVYMIFTNGTKQWVTSEADLAAAQSLWRIRGAPEEKLAVRVMEDPCLFTAMGLVVGPNAQDGTARDAWGNKT